MKKQNGFTLVEILISTAIMAMAVAGTLQILTTLIQMNETNENLILCTNAVQGIMDEVRNVDFSNIVATYNNKKFTRPELTAKGITHQGLITVTVLEPGYLLRVKVIICWQDKNRTMGEDENFNGSLDGGEDANGNGELDSPCMVEAAIAETVV